MSIPANNNPNRTSHHRYSVNQSRPGPGQTRTKEPSRSSRLGLLYVHCARAFTPLNTQRHGARFHGVGMYEPVQAGQRRRTWCPDRERERERRSTTPKMGYLPLPTLCTMNPAFDSGSVDLLCPLAQPSVSRWKRLFPLFLPRILLRATASNYKARGRLT